MKALILRSFKTAYTLEELEKPKQGKGEVLVKVHASGVNPLDLKIKAGLAAHAQAKLPAILGIDMAGTVEAVGEGVTGFRPGDEVYGMTGGIAGIQGSLAEYAVVDADLIAKKPVNITMQEAAAIPLAFITAWEGLVDRADIKKGKTVLLHGGGGGVGHIAVQLAVAKGAEVYTTVRSVHDESVKNYGAIPIDHTLFSVTDYVAQYTGGEGFDIILDTVGGTTLDDSFSAVKRYTGHVLSVLGWGTHSLAPLSFRGASYSGVFTLYPLISGKGRKHHGEILREATRLVEEGKLMPVLDPAGYTLKTVEKAYDALEKRRNRGKVVVTIC